jgi:hypothetical protein
MARAILKIDIISDYNDRGAQQAITATDRLNKASVAAGGALGVLAVGAKRAADAAINLNESTNAVQQVFGKASDEVIAFGREAARAAGLSQAEFQSLAVGTGSLLQNFGYAADEAADASITLAQRAADMASVFNTDVSTALEAVNAGLRGESEPLRAFGVNLNDAALKAKALELGLYAGTGALDANAKAVAAQALIMEQTAKTAGDFTNTATSAANRQRILAAEATNTAAQLGQALLPAMEALLGVAQRLVGWMSRNQAAVKAAAVAAAGLAAAVLVVNGALKVWQATTAGVTVAQKVLTVATSATTRAAVAQRAANLALTAASIVYRGATLAAAAAQRILNLAMRANPIGLVVTLLIALGAALVTAYNKSETFRRVIDRAFAAARGAIDAVGVAISRVIGWINALIGALSRIRWPSPPSWLGNLNPFTAAGVAPAVAPTSTGLARTLSATTTGTGRAVAPAMVNVYVTEPVDPLAVGRAVHRELGRYMRTTGAPAP